MVVTVVIVGTAIFVLAFFFQPSLHYDGDQARQLSAARDRAQREALRKELSSASVEMAPDATDVPRTPASRPARAWVLEFATQMRSIL
ncbi:hypothetical protein GTV32_14230 [Gordonia sp. SID5947]|uniref:hypothetical protein n=1 Tax=Gordonia sp. SID5947 TaxID=2690315 RepID=UPI001369BEAE|nr:hypothetical protein [Gordonia sp. SID5947]MYR07392.1 hypothetical protein [Gordonia sp. SID5947]